MRLPWVVVHRESLDFLLTGLKICEDRASDLEAALPEDSGTRLVAQHIKFIAGETRKHWR